MVEEISLQRHLLEACLAIMETAMEAADRTLAQLDAAATVVIVTGVAGFGIVVDALELVPTIEEGLKAVARTVEVIGWGAAPPGVAGLRAAMAELVEEMQQGNPIGAHDVLVAKMAPALRALRDGVCEFYDLTTEVLGIGLEGP